MEKINIETLVHMFKIGSQQIANNFEYINELNVFPVPDGDTGTNMRITINGAIETIDNKSFNSLSELGKTFSKGMLMNARGNSGVIFSQIIKGFTKSFPSDKIELNIKDLIKAFKEATEIAYKSVVQPVEGTILTVIRCVSEELDKKQEEFQTVEEVFKLVNTVAKKTLDLTPNMLPDLKIAGVVDSGGFGLVEFLKGMELAILGKDSSNDTSDLNHLKINSSKLLGNDVHLKEEGHGYCTEFLLRLGMKAEESQQKSKFSEAKLNKEINKFVNSIVLVSDLDEGIVKLHAHTLEPDKLLKAGLAYGEFIKVKVENMNLQVHERNNNSDLSEQTQLNKHEIINDKNLKNDVKVVATAPSRILGKLIKESYGVYDYIDTNESGNPSIGQFVELIKSCNSKNVIVAIDDTNILLAAKEAAKQVKKFINCEIIVGKNFIECMSAISAFLADENIRNNLKTMTRVMKNTGSACISTSVKTIRYPHIMVHKNDYIAVVDKKIIAAEISVLDCVIKTMKILVKKIKKPELVIIVYGNGIPIREVRQLEKTISEKFGLYCESVNGGQKVYNYLIGIQ